MKSPDSVLVKILNDAKSMGTLDSEGSFTIAGEAAIGKLAAFQLPRKSAWILKIVQAAVTCGSPSLRISQSNETTTFVFRPNENLDLKTLKEALLSPEVSGAPEVRHLAVGLRAVGFGDRRAFTLALDKDQVRTYIGWNGKVLVERAEPIPSHDVPLVHLGVAFPPEDLGRRLGGFAKSKGRATTEYQELVQNGEVCPIRLTVDGLRIDTLGAPPTDLVDGSSVPLSVGWSSLGTNGSSDRLLLPPGVVECSRKWMPSDKFTDARIFYLDGEGSPQGVSSIAKLSYSYKIVHYGSRYRKFEFRAVKRFSEYCWVKDGVICHREPSLREASAVSFRVYLPANDIPSDISGLTIALSEQTEQRKDRARERLQFQVQNTLEAIDHHVPRPFARDAVLGGAIGVLCMFGAPFTAGGTLFGAAVGVIAAAGSAVRKKQVMEDCKYHLRRLGDRIRNPEPTHRSTRN